MSLWASVVAAAPAERKPSRNTAMNIDWNTARIIGTITICNKTPEDSKLLEWY